MPKKKLAALWICLLYFGALLLGYFGPWSWGSLGVFRPSDDPNPEARAERAMALYLAAQEQFSDMYRWTAGGFLILLLVLVWCSIPRTKSMES